MTEPAITTRAEQPYLGITRELTMTTFGLLADRIPDLISWLLERNIPITGAPFFRYNVIDMAGTLEVEAGIPIPNTDNITIDNNDMFLATLPAGRYVTLTHVGHPDQLMSRTVELLNWALERNLRWDATDTEHGERWGCRLESYLTNPQVEPDMNKWHTELAFRLAD